MCSVIGDQEEQERDLKLVSACLLGIACRFDGQSCPAPELHKPAVRGEVVPVCPELLGDLSTPRPPAEIENAAAGLDGHAVLDGQTRVLRSDGVDITAQFIRGAQATLDLALRLGIQQAILKARSPSCGAGWIHEGEFAGTLVPGDGVAAALLKRNGIQVVSETDLSGEET